MFFRFADFIVISEVRLAKMQPYLERLFIIDFPAVPFLKNDEIPDEINWMKS